MMAIIKSLIYVATYTSDARPVEHICNKDFSHLKPRAMVSFAIGCQEGLYGRRLYSEAKLKELYEKK